MTLKNKILILCGLNKMTVKQLAFRTGFSEQSYYRWFKENSMEIKHLRKIAAFFKQDISYFFNEQDPNALQIDENVVQESKAVYVSNKDIEKSLLYDKIKLLEENKVLLEEKLKKCLAEVDVIKTKQPV